MADTQIPKLEEILRFRVREYMKRQSWGIELKNAILRFEREGFSVFMVGGFLRDLMLHGMSAVPRDIDLVFNGASAEKVEYLFWNYKERKNRFGGMRLKLNKYPFDVWSLADTWAFRNKKVERVAISTFPQTTFLNVDAIAFKWGGNSEDQIFSNGFFESIVSRTIEINLEENPFPETCVVRSLMMASMLHFSIGPRLAAYISRYSRRASLHELQRIQKEHYGYIGLDGEDLRCYFKAINAQLHRSKNAVVSLPLRQMKLEEQGRKADMRPKRSLLHWTFRIAEIAFIHSRYLRRLHKGPAKTKQLAMTVMNVQPHWLKKLP
jgi:hypothetical protein